MAGSQPSSLQLSVPPAEAPRVWLLLGDKAGDNAQVETVEKALPWACERKYVHVREAYATAKPRVKPTLHHIDLSRSDSLQPPWPDLVITIGRRPSMAALWIREQSAGRTKIALVGKPSGPLRLFDLIVVSAEAQLPPLPNVLAISLPLMRVDLAALETAALSWSGRLSVMPKPLIAVLVGGPTGPFVYDDSVTRRLLELASEIARDKGGTPYITTSRRTPPAVVSALRDGLPPGAVFFEWGAGALDNPYRGLLALADGFVVTGDSISMMVEVARIGRPLAIFELSTSRIGTLDQLRRSLARWLFSPSADTRGGRLRRSLGRGLYHLRLVTQTRDFQGFYQLLVDRGLAQRAGEGFRPPTGEVPDDLSRVVERIKTLVASG